MKRFASIDLKNGSRLTTLAQALVSEENGMNGAFFDTDVLIGVLAGLALGH